MTSDSGPGEYRCFSRVTSRVRPSGRAMSCHAQLESGLLRRALMVVRAGRSERRSGVWGGTSSARRDHLGPSAAIGAGSSGRSVGPESRGGRRSRSRRIRSRLCRSHGQTSSGGVSMVMARVAVKWGRVTSSSPGRVPCTSCSVAPHRRCQLRSAGETRNDGSAAMVRRLLCRQSVLDDR